MEMIKKLCILALLIISTFSGLALTKTAAESQKNFLKVNSDKILKSKTDSSVQANIQLTSKTENILPVVGNHKLETNLTEEEKYEMERANAMAEFLF
jgi:hypothetical protein